MFITLYALFCLNVAEPGTCVKEFVTDSSLQENMTMMSCMGLTGQSTVAQWADKHPLYHSWKVKGWHCRIDAQKPPRTNEL
jgi:hypothetical protein